VAVEEFRYGADGSIPFVPQTKEGPAANPSPGCKTPSNSAARKDTP
jgi:hypothetical protein